MSCHGRNLDQITVLTTFSATFVTKVSDYIIPKISSQQNYKLGKILSFINLRNLAADSDESLAMIYAMFIIDRLGNVTYPDYNKRQVSTDWFVILDSFSNPNNVLQFTNVLSPMSFITCNTKGLSLFPFSEFWNVFTTNVWILLCASLVTLVFSFKFLSGKHIFRKQTWQPKELLCLLKVLVEQGDPFPNSLLQSMKFRLLTSGILLAGIVLSNCYKSNNVYNMVKQRELVPYDVIEEILDENITIFSRVTYLNYYLRNGLASWIDNLVNLRSEPGYFQIAIQARIGIDTDENNQDIYGDTEAKIYYERLYAADQENSDTKEIVRTLTSALPHPKFVDLIMEPLQALFALNKAKYLPKQIWSRTSEANWDNALTSNFLNRQAKFIYGELKRCNVKSAWLVPTYVGKKFARALHNEKSYAHVGSQSFDAEKIRLLFNGMVPIQVMKYFAAALESGILEWLENFISMDSFSNLHSDASPVVKPSMRGNIIVLFIIWAFGVSLAFAVHLVEIYKLIYQFFAMGIRAIKVSYTRITIQRFS